MTADVLALLRCPRDGSRLQPRADGALVSERGGHVYPVIAGIYDFRLFDPPYMTREAENRLALAIDEAARRMDHTALVRHFESDLAPDAHDKQMVEKHIRHRMALRERAPRRLLDMLAMAGCAVPRDGTALDLGCGSGEAMATLLAQGARRVVGVDISLIELVLAKKLLQETGLDALLIAGCAEALPFADDSFDFVYSPDVIEHVSSQPDYLGEAHRVLRDQGVFLLNSPNRYSVVCPEPHVGIWFLTFLPRPLIDPVCRLAGKGRYVGKRLVSLPELRALVRDRFREVRIRSREANPQATSLPGRLFYALRPYSEQAFAYIADQHVVLARK
jgi:SAM-dependent methyltransferase